MGNRKTTKAAIPEPREDNVIEVLARVKENVEVANMVRGDPLDAFVSFRDLIDGGLAQAGGLLQGTGGAGLGGSFSGDHTDVPGPGSVFLAPVDINDLVLPGRPQNVHTRAIWDGIMVKWDWPDAAGTNVYWARAIVWASPTPSFEHATVAGYTTTNQFAHTGIGLSAPEIPGVTTQPGVRYYWVAWQGLARPLLTQQQIAGVEENVPQSPPTPYHSENGIRGQTAIDPEYALNILEGQITESHIYDTLNQRIDLIDHDEDGNQIFFEPVQTRILAASQATENSVYAAIAETATTSAANGMLQGEYALRIDLDGFVVGFGLSAFSTIGGGGQPQVGSAFVIKAHRFGVVTPGAGPGGNPVIPFIVGDINGQSAVGVNGQLIVDGTITANSIQAETIGAREINSQEVATDIMTANTAIAGVLKTSVDPNFRVEINGFDSPKSNFPIWFGRGTTGDVTTPNSQPLFFVDFNTATGNSDMKLSGNLFVTGSGNFFAGNFEGNEHYLQLGNPSSDFMVWAGKGPATFGNDDYVFYIDNEGNAKFKGTVEAEFVSGEVSRTHIIRNFYDPITLPPQSTTWPNPPAEGDWLTVGEYELPAPVFTVGHVPYINVSYNHMGVGQLAGNVRVMFNPNPDGTPGGPPNQWINIVQTTTAIESFAEEKTIQGVWNRVFKRSAFRIQMCGFRSSQGSYRPENSHQIGCVMGIR